MAAMGKIGLEVLLTCHFCACLWAWSTFIFVDFGTDNGELPGTSWVGKSLSSLPPSSNTLESSEPHE